MTENTKNKKFAKKVIKKTSVKRVAWTPAEDEILLSFEGTDKELAVRLGRTVKSIQLHRRKLRDLGMVTKKVIPATAESKPVKSESSVSEPASKFRRTSKKVVDLTLGDVFILPNGNKYICNSLVEPEVRDGKIIFEFIGQNTVRYICIIPHRFGYPPKSIGMYGNADLLNLECTFLYNVWDFKVD